MARPVSVNVGLPRDSVWKGRIVRTAIWNNPVQGRCRVGRPNLDGDGQGDPGGHGGEQRAVFVYQIDSCRYWAEQLAVAFGSEPLDQPADGNLLICCLRPTSDAVMDV